MKILGIDPGTAIVGYGLIENIGNKLKHLEHGCMYTNKDKNMNSRLKDIFNDLNTIFDEFKPDAVAIEEIFYFKNNKTIISVSQARGVILLAAELKNIPIYEYTPLQVKMGITGYGRAEKKQIQLMVKKILNLSDIPKPDDAADALAIAVTHIHSNISIIPSERRINSCNKNLKIEGGKISAKDYRNLL
jgi:crossover junction endodeoxyribonuclease RuvC